MVLHFREKVRVLELRLKDSDTIPRYKSFQGKVKGSMILHIQENFQRKSSR